MWWEDFTWQLACGAAAGGTAAGVGPGDGPFEVRLAGPPLARPELAEKYRVCEEALTVYDAQVRLARGSRWTTPLQGAAAAPVPARAPRTCVPTFVPAEARRWRAATSPLTLVLALIATNAPRRPTSAQGGRACPMRGRATGRCGWTTGGLTARPGPPPLRAPFSSFLSSLARLVKGGRFEHRLILREHGHHCRSHLHVFHLIYFFKISFFLFGVGPHSPLCSRSPPHCTLRAVRTRQSPRIAFVYTRGYDDTFGAVVVAIPEAPGNFAHAQVMVHGCCNSRNVTQGELMVLNAAQEVMLPPRNQGSRHRPENTHMFGFGIKPHTNATLQLRFLKTYPGRPGEPSTSFGKFSVRFVSSC